MNLAARAHLACIDSDRRLTANHVSHSCHITLSCPHLSHVWTHSCGGFIPSTENLVDSSSLQQTRCLIGCAENAIGNVRCWKHLVALRAAAKAAPTQELSRLTSTILTSRTTEPGAAASILSWGESETRVCSSMICKVELALSMLATYGALLLQAGCNNHSHLFVWRNQAYISTAAVISPIRTAAAWGGDQCRTLLRPHVFPLLQSWHGLSPDPSTAWQILALRCCSRQRPKQ